MRAERVEQVALQRPRHARGRRQVVDRRALGAEHRAGVGGRHVAARPVLGAADRPAGAVEHHDEAGQVLVHRAEAVVHPRAQRRAAALQLAGVHHQHGRAVDRRLGGHRVQERDVVDALAEVREQVADPFAALAVLVELPPRLDDAALVLLCRRGRTCSRRPSCRPCRPSSGL